MSSYGFNVLKEGINSNYRRIYCIMETIEFNVISRLSMFINNDFSWILSVYGHPVKDNCSVLNDLPKILTDENIENTVKQITRLKICPGNVNF